MHTIKLYPPDFALKYILIIAIYFAVAGCAEIDEGWPQYQLSGNAMGTTWQVTLVVESQQDIDSIRRESLLQAIAAEIESVEQSMSTYRIDSELSLLNNLSVDQWHPISDALYQVLDMSLKVSASTAGAFDITLGEAVNTWGFGPQTTELTESASHTSAHSPSLDKNGHQLNNDDDQLNKAALNNDISYDIKRLKGKAVFRKERQMLLDLSAIAKGYAVDQVAHVLDQQSFDNYLIEIGGELKVKGKNSQRRNWRIAIEAPAIEQMTVVRSIHRTLALTDVAVATSGNYRNYRVVDGQNYGHIINSSTGQPVQSAVLSATVIHHSAAIADAWATALMAQAPGRGVQQADDVGLAAYLIVDNGDGTQKVHFSKQFSGYILN